MCLQPLSPGGAYFFFLNEVADPLTCRARLFASSSSLGGGATERNERTVNASWQGLCAFWMLGFEILQKYKDKCCCFPPL